jgi:uncharacterized protein (TIGR03086 family)
VCSGWTVKDVADHVLGGNRFAVGLLAGATADEALQDARAQTFVGDPVALHRASAVAQLAAFSAPGALDLVVHHPAGEIAGRQFLAFRLGDLLLHGWDLARSTGGDETLDDELLPLVWEAYQPILTTALDHGAFGDGPTGDVPDDSPLWRRLLDLTGRRP